MSGLSPGPPAANSIAFSADRSHSCWLQPQLRCTHGLNGVLAPILSHMSLPNARGGQAAEEANQAHSPSPVANGDMAGSPRHHKGGTPPPGEQQARSSPAPVGSLPRSDTGDSERSSSSRSISLHYDPRSDIILRLEFITARALKNIILLVWFATACGLAILIWALYLKTSRDDSYFFTHNTLEVVNTVFASGCVLLLATCWGLYARRVYRSHQSKKRWSTRRLKAVQTTAAELTLQLVNATFFLLPNAYVLAKDCAWFAFSDLVVWAAFVRWTCWNCLFFMFWVQASNSRPARGRWGEPTAYGLSCLPIC